MKILLRYILAIAFIVIASTSAQAANNLITQQITIKLDKAGTLPNKIGSTRKYQLTNLKIIGEINGTDLRMIRDMAGRSDLRDLPPGEGMTSGKLSVLDLSEAKIVEGGDYYYYNSTYAKPEFYTSEDCLGDHAFQNCSALTSLTIPSSVTKIGSYAFENCEGLTNVNIPSSVTEIGYYAFALCTGLTSVTIHSSVTEIGVRAFKNCSGLTNVNIPSSVTKIGSDAFTNCTSLTSVYVSWQSPISANNAFDRIVRSKCTLYVPQGTYQDYFLADEWGDFENIVEYDATGINNVTTSSDAKEVYRYSLNGQRLSAPTKGVNIVKYSDGSVKKVDVQ